jgi:acetolactate synthase-1/2/3 large subunit
MTRLSGAMAVIRSLEAHGIDTVFGLPGGQLDHLFDALYQRRDRIRLIASRHEQGAAYMAFGYARSTGNPAVYTVVPGPGILNTAAALCTAYACNSPVLCLGGQIPSESIGKGFGELHELPDQLGILRRLTKWAARIESPDAAPRMVARAFATIRSGRPRPVALEMAPDVMAQQAEVPDLAVEAIPTVPPNPELIRRAAEIIATAHTPMIYVGGGAIGATAAIRQLAEILNAPVASFRSGRGIVPDEHPLGFTLPAGHRYWPKVDVLIGIGSRLLEPLRHWGIDPELKIIRIDIDPEEIARAVEPDVGLVCDASAAISALIPEVEKRLDRRPARREPYFELKAAVAADIERVQPQVEYLKVIRQVLPHDGFLCDEITQCGFASWYAFPVSRPREHINCGYQGTLGYGYATALGVKIAHPDRPVVSISGDGGFFFNLSELATAVQHGIDLKTIVFNSGSYANVQRQQREWFGNRIIASDLRNPDFIQLAESFGAAGYRAESPAALRRVLERSLSEKGPAVIEVPVGEMVSPWPLILLPRVRGSTSEGHAA